MKVKKSIKVIASPFLAFGYTWLFLLDVGFWIFTFLFPFSDGRIVDNFAEFVSKSGIFLIIFVVILMGVFPLLILIFSSYRAFSIIEISEKWIKRSLFAVFGKRELLWEDIVEIRVFWQAGTWLFVSKSPLENLNYNQLIKHKESIQITASLKVLQAIKQYYDKPIIGLNEVDKMGKSGTEYKGT